MNLSTNFLREIVYLICINPLSFKICFYCWTLMFVAPSRREGKECFRICFINATHKMLMLENCSQNTQKQSDWHIYLIKYTAAYFRKEVSLVKIMLIFCWIFSPDSLFLWGIPCYRHAHKTGLSFINVSSNTGGLQTSQNEGYGWKKNQFYKL